MNEFLGVFERSIFYLLNHSLSNPVFDILMPFLTTHVEWFFVLILVFYGLLNRRPKDLVFLFLVMLVCVVVSDALANTLKHLLRRPRPFLVLPDVRLLVGMGHSYAMPSGHATNTTSVATVVWFFLKQRPELSAVARRFFKGYLVLLVLLVGFSRVYVGVHWPGDVLAGTVLGIGVGYGVIRYIMAEAKAVREGQYLRGLFLIVLALTLFRFYYIYTGPLRLSPDEAHYWDWSRRLQLSYYSKPPMVAYLIGISTSVFGDNEFGVRFFAPLLGALSSVVMFFLTRRVALGTGMSPARAELCSMVASLLLLIVPLFATFNIIMTVDAPLMFFWTLGLYLMIIAVERGGFYWALLGLCVGSGMLTKFTMALFYFCAFLYLITDRQSRRKLLGPGPWVAFVVSLLLYLPVLYWNSQNNWVYFKHVAGHGGLSRGSVLDVKDFFEFIGSQLGVITPVILFLMVWAVVWLWKNKNKGRIFFWFSIPVWTIFLLKSLQSKVQANWAMPGYIAGVSALAIFVSSRWEEFSTRMRAFVVSGVLLAFLATVIAHYPQTIGLPARLDPSARLRGWDQLASKVDSLRKGLGPEHFVFSDRYQITAELAFYLKDQPRTYCVNLGRRMNQYDLWEGFYHLKGYDAVFVQKGKTQLAPRIKDSFEECKSQEIHLKEDGNLLRTHTVWICRGFKGMKKILPRSY